MAFRHFATSAQSVALRATDLLLPTVCFACGGEATAGDDPALCMACRADLRLIAEPACRNCGAPLVDIGGGQGAPCAYCQRDETRFDEAYALGEYTGLLRELILEAKHPTSDAVAGSIGRVMGKLVRQRCGASGFDLVVPIPMHWTRRVARGANSPDRMAEEVARVLGVPMRRRLLRRPHRTRKQTELARSSRMDNVRRAFVVGPGLPPGASILLVDDILTTGSTLSAATTALKRAGAGRVAVVVAARTL